MCLRCLYVSKDKPSEEKNQNQLLSRKTPKFIEPYGYIKQGAGSKCQDTFTIMPNLDQNTHFFAVYDGAGQQGNEVVNKAEATMRSYIERNYKKLNVLKKKEEYHTFMNEGFIAMQKALESYKLDYQNCKSGACCTCVLISGNMAYVANVGNCRAVLCTTTKDGIKIPVDLSNDHTVESLRERERCIRAGAKISQASPSAKMKVLGPERVWYNDEGPGITSTRMLGYNKHGITSEPEIVSFEIQANDKFIVLGTDGLWDVLGSKDVVNFVNMSKEKKNTSEELIFTARMLWEREYGKSEYRFIGDDITQNSLDDISVVLVYLNDTKD